MGEALGLAPNAPLNVELIGRQLTGRLAVLLVVRTPMERPEQIVQLARGDSRHEPQVLDETAERGEDGAWRYRDARVRAEWRIR
jgi:hypothetical protein